MIPMLQVGLAMLVIALSYAIILAASTAAFVIVDRRSEIFPPKKEEMVKDDAEN